MCWPGNKKIVILAQTDKFDINGKVIFTNKNINMLKITLEHLLPFQSSTLYVLMSSKLIFYHYIS
jgi:hypothetical protein